MQHARLHDNRAKISKDICAYIFGSHIRTHSQFKKYVFFIKLDEKILSLRENFPKLDIIFSYILLHCEKCALNQCTRN